jgi:hypothetical protein
MGFKGSRVRISPARPVESTAITALESVRECDEEAGMTRLAAAVLPVLLASGAVHAAPASVTLVGSLQTELGCPGDWQADCFATVLTYDPVDKVWQGTFLVPAGSWEYRAALDGSIAGSYGVGADPMGANVPLVLAGGSSVKFYYDDATHWVVDDVGGLVVVAPGSFQSEVGCPGDWDPSCLRTWLEDPDGDGRYRRITPTLPPGDYEVKVTHGEAWDENYGAGGVPGGANIPFTVPDPGFRVAFDYDPVSHVLAIEVLEPGRGVLLAIALVAIAGRALTGMRPRSR